MVSVGPFYGCECVFSRDVLVVVTRYFLGSLRSLIKQA